VVQAAAPPPPPQAASPATPATGPAQAPRKSGGCLKIGLIGVALVIGMVVCVVVVGALDLISLPDIDSILSSSTLGPSGTAAVLVENDSSVEICYVLISPSSAESWGEDWLGENDTILPGAERTFYITSNQSIDLQVYDCDENMLDEQYNINLDDDGIVYTLEDVQ